MALWLLQFRLAGESEWRTLRADVRSRTLGEAKGAFDKVIRRVIAPPGTVYRVAGKSGLRYYFHRPLGEVHRVTHENAVAVLGVAPRRRDSC